MSMYSKAVCGGADSLMQKVALDMFKDAWGPCLVLFLGRLSVVSEHTAETEPETLERGREIDR